MKTIIIPSIPSLGILINALGSSLEDNIDAFTKEPLISSYTYHEAEKVYSEDEMSELNKYMLKNCLILGEDKVGGFLTWSRFEDAHLPRLSNYNLKVPTREVLDSYDYTIYNPVPFSARRHTKLILKLGIRAVVPKGKALILSMGSKYAGELTLASPGIITGIGKELEVTLIANNSINVPAGEPLLKAVLVTAEVLNTDSFVPRRKLEVQDNGDNSDKG